MRMHMQQANTGYPQNLKKPTGNNESVCSGQRVDSVCGKQSCAGFRMKGRVVVGEKAVKCAAWVH